MTTTTYKLRFPIPGGLILVESWDVTKSILVAAAQALLNDRGDAFLYDFVESEHQRAVAKNPVSWIGYIHVADRRWQEGDMHFLRRIWAEEARCRIVGDVEMKAEEAK